VGVLGHHAGQNGNAQLVQEVGDAVDGDGRNAGIAENHLIVTGDSRIAFIGGPHIGGQDFSQIHQGLDKAEGLLLPLFIALLAGPMVSDALMADAVGDFQGKKIVKGGDLLAYLVLEADPVNVLAAEITGEEDVPTAINEINGPLPGGKGIGVDVFKALIALAALDKFIHHFRDSGAAFTGNIPFICANAFLGKLHPVFDVHISS